MEGYIRATHASGGAQITVLKQVGGGAGDRWGGRCGVCVRRGPLCQALVQHCRAPRLGLVMPQRLGPCVLLTAASLRGVAIRPAS